MEEIDTGSAVMAVLSRGDKQLQSRDDAENTDTRVCQIDIFIR